MSIFGIIAICLMIWVVVGLIIAVGIIGEGCCYILADDKIIKVQIITGVCAFVLFIGSIFIGIGINTEKESIFVKKYLAQKETIEASLEVEELGGLERLELVKQATELNAKVAEKKARFELWHFVVYDKTIYNGVELINLKGDKQQWEDIE